VFELPSITLETLDVHMCRRAADETESSPFAFIVTGVVSNSVTSNNSLLHTYTLDVEFPQRPRSIIDPSLLVLLMSNIKITHGVRDPLQY
jgi:hypothetical protein